ncbi:unnamed protein product [Blepharisma stoltei]|uniref:ADP-ribosylation factor n=1 Tax=Blepharisma stoltei TaxID=1481888 RepID=A0AAU9IYS5_9CILI|nr:unnamed protein product [Blepharisma stoltei]
MGSIISQFCDFFEKIWQLIFEGKEKRLLMVGLNASGKTAILYQLKLGDAVSTISTIGFNVETIRHKNVRFNIWDVGGDQKIRPLWRHYYQGTDGLIFVIDGTDRDRIGEANDELHKIFDSEDMKEIPLLIFANKQDLPGAMRVSEIVERLNLYGIKNREWYAQGSCAIRGEGLFEGLEWLGSIFKAQRKKLLLEAYRRKN